MHEVWHQHPQAHQRAGQHGLHEQLLFRLSLRRTACRTPYTQASDYINSCCLDCPFEGQHAGHPTHKLWQKGTCLRCTHCGMQLHLDNSKRIITTANFLKECKGAGIKGSPPIQTFFKTTPPTPSGGDSGEKKPTELATPMSTTGPRPKRLHFPTPLTARDDDQYPAKAMTPSPPAGSKHRDSAATSSRPAGLNPASPTSSQEQAEEESQTDDAMQEPRLVTGQQGQRHLNRGCQ